MVKKKTRKTNNQIDKYNGGMITYSQYEWTENNKQIKQGTHY